MRVLVLLICAAIAALLPVREAAGAPRVVATTTDIGALVRVIGGESVEITEIARGDQDPHYLDAKPSHMSKLRKADLLLYIGLDLEAGWLPLLVQGARNPSLLAGAPGNVPLHEGIDILEVPIGEVTRAEGDVHPLGNPHYWLDPRNLPRMAETVESGLSRLVPEESDVFARQREDFIHALGTKLDDWTSSLEPYRGQKVVCYHKQWEYLCNWLGLEIAGYVETKAGIPPSPRHVAELEQRIRDENIGVILISNFFEPAPAENLASRTGARLVVLPPSVGGEEDTDDLFAHFDLLVARLAEALAEGSSDE